MTVSPEYLRRFFLLAFFYEIIFGKGFDGMYKFVTGFAFAWSFNKLFSSSNDEEPRKKIFGGC